MAHVSSTGARAEERESFRRAVARQVRRYRPQEPRCSPRGPFLSANGAWIGFYYGATSGIGASLGKVPIGGGAPIKIADVDANLRGAAWGADDTIIYATIEPTTGLMRVRASGGTPEVLTRPAVADNERDHRWPFLLPDGKHVLFEVARTGGVGSSDIGLLSLDTMKSTVLLRSGTFPRYVKTGHILYGSVGGLRAVEFDLQSLSLTGDPVRVLDGVVIKESGAVDFGQFGRRHACLRARQHDEGGQHSGLGRSDRKGLANRGRAATLSHGLPVA